jgi:isoamyl acetate esterase
MPAFGPALQHAYLRRADVINRGFGGYNTEWLLPVLQQQIIPSVFNVVLWIILIGANDAMLAPGPNHVLQFLAFRSFRSQSTNTNRISSR